MSEEQNTPTVPNFEGEEMKMPENSRPVVAEEAPRSSMVNGPLLFILTILLIVILGGMYYWFSKLNMDAQAPVVTPPIERPTDEENNEPESTTAEAQTDVIEVTSTSDEVSAIESDLESTDFDAIDAELNAIDAEINAALTQ